MLLEKWYKRPKEFRNLCDKLIRARGLIENVNAQLRLIEQVISNEVSITEESVDTELKEILSKLNFHPECGENFLKTGRAEFINIRNIGDCCHICGLVLKCGDKIAKHKLKEISYSECRKRNIFHRGMHHNIYECENCGAKKEYESGD